MTEHEPTAQDIAAMDEAERAQWFYDNREQVAEESTPVIFDGCGAPSLRRGVGTLHRWLILDLPRGWR